MNTINMYPNLQYDPIEIPKYCILEIYKDSIAETNSLGYTILNIEGKSNSEIEQEIKTKVAASAPNTYTKLAILAGNTFVDYTNKIVYCVWYTGDIVPAYPEEPTITPLDSPGQQASIWEVININNPGVGTIAALQFNINNSLNKLEFYLNDVLYSIDLKDLKSTNSINIDKGGLRVNGEYISSFSFNAMPALKSGQNVIKINKVNTTNFSLIYSPRY